MPHDLNVQERVAQIAQALPRVVTRQIIAIAGPPASGKSTLAEALVAHLHATGQRVGLLAMDGFHLGNDLLDARNLRSRKGAPETFDLAGFTAMVQRLRLGEHVFVPIFDRALDTGLASSAEIPGDAGIVVVEGNYLLLDAPGWRDLAAFWDFTVFLDVPEPVLHRRLIARWLVHGFDAAGAEDKAEGNDLPNARRVLRDCLQADLTVKG